MKVYIDVCCYNRPFDDQGDDRIHLETEAILSVLNRGYKGELEIISSEVVEFEISRIIDIERKKRVSILSAYAKEKVKLNRNIEKRGYTLKKMGFKPIDALHIACAEAKHVDVFLTTDDKLLRRAKKYIDMINIRVENPVIWLMEVRKK